MARRKYEALPGQNNSALVRDWLPQIEAEHDRGVRLEAVLEAIKAANQATEQVQKMPFVTFKKALARARQQAREKAAQAVPGQGTRVDPVPDDVTPEATPAPMAEVTGVMITTPTRKRFDYSTSPGGDLAHILGPTKSAEGKK